MYQMLQTGEWQIADNCPRVIEAIRTRIHDEKRPGEVLKVPGDPLDDVADDVRYGIYTFITATEKPNDLAMRERLRPLAEQGDLTSALVRFRQMEDEAEANDTPMWRPGRYHRRRCSRRIDHLEHGDRASPQRQRRRLCRRHHPLSSTSPATSRPDEKVLGTHQ
jgi:hypothetical protein